MIKLTLKTTKLGEKDSIDILEEMKGMPETEVKRMYRTISKLIDAVKVAWEYPTPMVAIKYA